jgi:mono/diheme cytochrome c family protein
MIAGRCWMFLASVSLAAAWLAGCDSMPGRPTQAEYPLRPLDVVNFSDLYNENCAGCHGKDGKSGAALALNNPVYISIIDDGSMTKIIAQGVPATAMPPFAQSSGGTLSDAQIAIIVDGIRKRWSAAGATTGAPPYLAVSAGDPTRGAQVYANFCQSCHGVDGKGGIVRGSIVDGSYLALISDQDLRAIVIAGRPDLGHPDWKGYVAGQPMTDAQVSDVVAWLASKRQSAVRGASYADGH